MRNELYNGEILKDGINCAIKKGGNNTPSKWFKVLDYFLTAIYLALFLYGLKYLYSFIVGIY